MTIRFRTKSVSFRIIPILLMMYSALIPLENVLAASFGGSINKYIGLLIMGLICMWCIKNRNTRIYIPKQMFAFSCRLMQIVLQDDGWLDMGLDRFPR